VIYALLQGTLVADPVARETRNGARFVTGTIRVASGVDTIFVGLAVFDEAACDRLGKLQKGSAVSAAGTFEANIWTDREGREKSGWRLTATEIMSLAQAQRRRKDAATEPDESLA
jgi:single-strand DNA-binding protein